MTSAAGKASTGRRPHDSEASRGALLEAAGAVFDELGYERATTRQIGERAGVDPALIARYYGGKEGLFLAAIAEGPAGKHGRPPSYAPAELLAFLLERWDERGHSPVSRALASPTLSDGVRSQVRSVVGANLVEPLVEELRGRGTAQPELRAELLIALALGVAVTRANGTLKDLSEAPRSEVIAALEPLVAAVAES